MGIEAYTGAIERYNKTVQDPVDYAMLVERSGGAITVEKPLKPAGVGLKILAALSGLPVFGSLPALKQAREEMAKLKADRIEQMVHSLHCLQGFVAALRETYGEAAALLCETRGSLGQGKPLTARCVQAALSLAGAQQQEQRDENDRGLAQFLDPCLSDQFPQMRNLVFDKSTPSHTYPVCDEENGQTMTWKTRCGPAATAFIEAHIKQSLRADPAYATRQLLPGMPGRDPISPSARQAVALYHQIRQMPSMTDAIADKAFATAAQACVTSAGTGAQQMREIALRTANEGLVEIAIEEKLNCKNLASLLSQQANAVAGKPPQPFSFPEPVLKSIANGMAAKLTGRVGKLPEELKCRPDANSVITALEPRLVENLRTVLEGHRAALAAIEESALNDTQKAKLRQIADTQCLDPAQITAYEATARRLSSAATSIGAALDVGDFVTALITLREAAAEANDSTFGMKKHGDAFWESGSLRGGDMTMTLVEQFAAAAVGAMTPEVAGTTLAQFTGEKGRQLVRGLMDDSSLVSLNAEAQAKAQVENTASVVLLIILIEALAVAAGKGADEARRIADAVSPAPNAAPSAALPAALVDALALRAVGANFRAHFKQSLEANQEEVISFKELPGANGKISTQLYKDLKRDFVMNLQEGDAVPTSMIDRTGWGNLTPEEIDNRIVGGVNDLVAFCRGDPDRAARLTQALGQQLAVPFMFADQYAVEPEHSLMQLADGALVRIAESKRDVSLTLRRTQDARGESAFSIRFSINETVSRVATVDANGIAHDSALNPEKSHCNYVYTANFSEDETALVLPENATVWYDINFVESADRRG